MFATRKAFCAIVLAGGSMFVMAGPANAQHHHHGGHHHHHGLYGFGHLHYYPSYSFGLGYRSYPSYYRSYPSYYYYNYSYSYVYPRSYPSIQQLAPVQRLAQVQQLPPIQPPPPLMVQKPLVAATDRTRIEVRLPDPDGEVWFEGRRSRATGTTRTFESPPIESGKIYTYNLTAAWNREGKLVTEERKVEVTAGNTVVVDFTHSAVVGEVAPLTKRDLQPE